LIKSNIKISVIIPVYNGALLIKRCLKSVIGQYGEFNIELILVDDGSTDHSINIAKTLISDIVVIRQKNQGPAAARNRGIEKATGKYLAFLDADDYWDPYFLKATVAFLEIHDVIAVNVGQVHKVIGKEDGFMPKFIKDNQFMSNEGFVLDDFYEFWSLNNHVCTGSVLMLTEIVKQTGGQRPELRITEDLEFWAYLATYGKWGFIPKVLFTSDGGEVTKEQGWLEKNKKRWASAPSIDLWEARIIKNLPKNYIESFNKAKKPILKNLTLSMILSDRIEEARSMIKKHKASLSKDKVSILLKFGSYSRLSWKLLAKLIISRENNRKL